MIKIQIKSIFGKVLFEYEKENNTIKDTVERANLDGANLYGANLDGANLDGANLTRANLTRAKIISVSRIGSRKGMTTYDFDKDIIWCGCFKGTLDEFEDKVNETHKDNEQYLKEYLGFINYLKSLK